MNNIQVFNNPEFGDIRTVEIDGKPYFVGTDVAKALGYKDTVNALKQHCRGVVKHHLIDSLGRNQEASFIPEGDLYRLIMKSKLPSAEKFESWVMDTAKTALDGATTTGNNALQAFNKMRLVVYGF